MWQSGCIYEIIINTSRYLNGGKMKSLKIIIEKHPEGYVAYPLGLKGAVVGEGNTYDEALENVKSAIKFHIGTFGEEVFETEEIKETFIAEVII